MAQIRSKQISDFLSSITWANVTATDNVKIANVYDIKQGFDLVDESVNSLENYIAGEVSSLEAVDGSLSSEIVTEKGRIDAILAASTADKDSFAEIVSLIGSVDTENDQAFAGYVLSNNKSVDSLEAADVALGSRIDLNDTDNANLTLSVNSLEVVDSGLAGDIATEMDRAMVAEAKIASDLATEIASTNAEQVIQDASINSLEAADAGLEGDVTSINTRATGIEGNLSSEISRAEAAEGVLSSALAAEIASTDAEQLVQDKAISDEITRATGRENAIEGALTAEIERASAEEAKIAAQLALNDTDNVNLTLSVNSLEVVDAGLASDISDEKARIDAILLAATADADSFAEIVSLINSVDTTNDDAFAAYVLKTDASVDSLEGALTAEINSTNAEQLVQDKAISDEITRAKGRENAIEASLNSEIETREEEDSKLGARITANDTDNANLTLSVNSLEVVDAGLASDVTSIDTRVLGVEGDLAAEITRAGSVEGVLSSALAAEIATTGGEIVAIDASIDSLEIAVEAGGTYLRQTAVFAAANMFNVQSPVAFGVNDDLSVYVNGVFVDFRTLDGVTFDFTGLLAYSVDANDKVQVMGIEA